MRYVKDAPAQQEVLKLTDSLRELRSSFERLRAKPSGNDLKEALRDCRGPLAAMVDALEVHSEWLAGRSLCCDADFWVGRNSTGWPDAGNSFMTALFQAEDEGRIGIDMDYRQISKAFSSSNNAESFLANASEMFTHAGDGAAAAIELYFEDLKSGRVREFIQVQGRLVSEILVG